MTAKSRRRKLDKRRKTDEHSHARHAQGSEEARREACKRDHPAGRDLFPEGEVNVKANQQAWVEEVLRSRGRNPFRHIDFALAESAHATLERGLGEHGPFTPEGQVFEDNLERFRQWWEDGVYAAAEEAVLYGASSGVPESAAEGTRGAEGSAEGDGED